MSVPEESKETNKMKLIQLKSMKNGQKTLPILSLVWAL
jgi:hypothetical protein